MDALYNNKEFNSSNENESVMNIIQRYDDIKEFFPKDLKGKALPYFIDWMIEKVMLVTIKTHSDEDAYTIFETMNDRGRLEIARYRIRVQSFFKHLEI